MEKSSHTSTRLKSTQRFIPGLIYVLSAIAAFLVFLAGSIFLLQPVGTALDRWQVNDGNGWQDVQLPFIEMIKPERETLELRTSFTRVNADILVIPRQSGNAIEARLNGKLIYTLGDFSQPTANLWNYVQLIQLPEPLAEENLLEIRIVSIYFAAGLNNVPYLCRHEECTGRVVLLNWIYSDMANIIFGAGLITGLILVAMTFVRRKLVTPEFFVGVALLLGVIFLQDMPFRLTTGSVSTFLLAKKGFLTSGYLAALSFLCGIELQYWQKIRFGRWLTPIAFLAIVALFTASDAYSMTVVQTITNSGLIICLILIVGVIVQSKERPSWMLFPATLLIISLFLLLITLPLRITWPIMIPPVFVMTTLIIGMRLILDYNQLFYENINLQRMKNIDPLTGVYNRNVLSELRANLHDYVVMLDLDGFKFINDRYGHTFGDQVLNEFTRIVRQNLRRNDLVIRFGGDEFVLVLNGLPKTKQGFTEVVSILERIQKQFSELRSEIPLSFSYGITAIETNVEEAIKSADKQMYLVKEAKQTSRE